eukprot:2000053-Pleurochrysis_carterae.AAC.1
MADTDTPAYIQRWPMLSWIWLSTIMKRCQMFGSIAFPSTVTNSAQIEGEIVLPQTHFAPNRHLAARQRSSSHSIATQVE